MITVTFKQYGKPDWKTDCESLAEARIIGDALGYFSFSYQKKK